MSLRPILLTTTEVAEILRVSPDVVHHWRRAGIGPVAVTNDGPPMYDLAHVQAFLVAEPEQQEA